MTLKADIIQDEYITKFTLPPYICNNTREKIQAEKIPINHLKVKQKAKEYTNCQLVEYPLSKPVQPSPSHPLTITWSPDILFFSISDKEIIQRLWLWNTCYRTIYVHVCGFWDDTIRLGAVWRCYPHTRFRLAPGMKGEIYIQATPHIHSPTPCAYAGLQLAAAHMRDHVTGYFLIPVQVKFLNFKPPNFGESE